MSNTLQPKFRYLLKSEILKAGYQTLTDFSKALSTDVSIVSRVVKGWVLPGPNLQKKMAGALNITLAELKELLK